MNTPREPRTDDEPRMRRSTKVALILLGTAGVVGAAVVWDAWQRSRAQPATTDVERPAAEPVTADRTYANNTYIPGAGYYHAPFYGWFPFPWNHHDPARGYFSGGQWRATPFASDVMQSQPTAVAAAAALAAQRAREQQQRAQTSNFFRGGSSGGSSSTFSSRPSTAPSSKPSVIRGGFGSSSRGGSSGATS